MLIERCLEIYVKVFYYLSGYSFLVNIILKRWFYEGDIMKMSKYFFVVLVIILFAACATSISNFKVGKQLYDEGNYEQAIIELEKASMHDSSIMDRIHAFEYLGDAYTRKGNLKKAVLSFESAYSLVHVRIGEVIDERKASRKTRKSESYLNANTKGNAFKSSDELSDLKIRAKEIQVKIKHLK